MTRDDAAVGCLLGQAVGDMMGTTAENLSPRRVAKLFRNFDKPRFLFGLGMGTDDTEHAVMTLLAAQRYPQSVEQFRRSLAWRLRWWFFYAPPGIGLATLKSCIKLWLGVPSTRSGVISAGNGPAMRSAILGVMVDGEQLHNFVKASTRLTHTDPKAEYGAYAISRMIHTDGYDDLARQLIDDVPTDAAADELRKLLDHVEDALNRNLNVSDFASELSLNRGVTGYIYHTVPVAIFSAWKHGHDYRSAIEAVIRCGGDTDTVAAVTGALIGARHGKGCIPTEWLNSYVDWYWTMPAMENLAFGQTHTWGWKDVVYPIALPMRNLFFFGVVVVHLLRRLLPPW